MRWRLLLAALSAALAIAALGTAAFRKSPTSRSDQQLPALGTELAALPPGDGKAVADAHCLRCHSADMLRQQRLTERQWASVVDKMIGWGAEVPEGDKATLVAYLARSFGTDNRFRPVVTRPLEE